jgi:predicted ester cyclase
MSWVISHAISAVKSETPHIAAGIATLFAALPDVHWTTGSMLIDGDRAAVPYELTGHLHGGLGPYVPRGQTLSLPGVQLVEVKAGKIVATTDYWDGGALHRQLV